MSENIQNVDYPFFVATPQKPKNTGWKVTCCVLAAALAASVYLLATGFSLKQGNAADPGEAVDVAQLQSAVLTLEAEKNSLTTELEALQEQNMAQANRIIDLLNECNQLSMQLAQADMDSLTEEELEALTKTIGNYELIIKAQTAMIQKDKLTLEACVQELKANMDELPVTVKAALYVIMEYMG